MRFEDLAEDSKEMVFSTYIWRYNLERVLLCPAEKAVFGRHIWMVARVLFGSASNDENHAAWKTACERFGLLRHEDGTWFRAFQQLSDEFARLDDSPGAVVAIAFEAMTRGRPFSQMSLSRLYRACRVDKPLLVAVLLDHGLSPTAQRSGCSGRVAFGSTFNEIRFESAFAPLHAAAYYGHTSLVARLLRTDGVDVNAASSPEGKTPLMSACHAGRESSAVLHLLLGAPNVKVNAKDVNDRTALMYTTRYEHGWEAALALLGDGRVDVNATDNGGSTALMMALRTQKRGIVAALCREPTIDIEQPDHSGEQPLALALLSDDSCFLDALLQTHGIHRNLRAPARETMMAFVSRRSAMVLSRARVRKFLETSDVDVQTQFPSLFAEATGDGNWPLVRLMLRRPGVDVNAGPPQWPAPLVIACTHNSPVIARELLNAPGILVNARGREGMTALMAAAVHGRPSILRMLLAEPSIELNAKCDMGWTALAYALRGRNVEVVQTLLDVEGVDLAATDTRGRTLLMIAVSTDHTEIVDLLLQRDEVRQSINARTGTTRNSRTVLQLVRSEGPTRFADTLVAHGAKE